MSTVPPTNPPSVPPAGHTPATAYNSAATPRGPQGPREIKLISHSPIFYWWPIWVLGYVLALVTLFDNNRLAVVPKGTTVSIQNTDDKKTTYLLEVPGQPTKSLTEAVDRTRTNPDSAFKARVSERAWMGPVYCVVLLLTILITNVPLRGLWSFLVILMLVVLALIISLVPGGWEDLLGALGNLHIFINMAGYLFIATTVLILWAASVFVFDQRTYMIVSPGQIRVCEHIGASIRNFDTTGLSFEKQRDDLFRHWILGFFSGDLIVRTSGAEKEEIRFPNVLWIGWRLEQVQEILREKAMVTNK